MLDPQEANMLNNDAAEGGDSRLQHRDNVRHPETELMNIYDHQEEEKHGFVDEPGKLFNIDLTSNQKKAQIQDIQYLDDSPKGFNVPL